MKRNRILLGAIIAMTVLAVGCGATESSINDSANNDAVNNNATNNDAANNDAVNNDAANNDAVNNDSANNDAVNNDAVNNDATNNDPEDMTDPPEGVPPTVATDPIYMVERSTHTYAQGLVHDDWMGDVVETRDLILDLYEPVDAPPGRPAVFVIHGGGFVGGSRTNMNSAGFAQYFAERGFVAVSIDYRVAEDFGTLPQEWFDFVDGLNLVERNL